jgi:hypothetical protein
VRKCVCLVSTKSELKNIEEEFIKHGTFDALFIGSCLQKM